MYDEALENYNNALNEYENNKIKLNTFNIHLEYKNNVNERYNMIQRHLLFENSNNTFSSCKLIRHIIYNYISEYKCKLDPEIMLKTYQLNINI